MTIEIKECRHGRMMFYTNDFYIGGALDKFGEYSEGEINLWRQFLKPGMVVLDVGANIGAFTVPLAKMVGPSGSVYAIEPQRRCYQMLCGNLALNDLANVSVMLGCLGAEPGQIKIPAMDFSHTGNFGGVAAGAKDGDVVPVIPLDGMAIRSLHFVKVDVEGMEKEVIAGARQTIEKHRPILYVENDRAEKSAELIETVMGLDYRLWWHLPPIYSSDNFRKCTENPIGPVVSVNMLCIHRDLVNRIDGMREIISPADTSGVARGNG